MSAQQARRRSSVGRDPARPLRERRLSMELPERLQYDADEEEEAEEGALKEGQPPPFMHQSIFGIIAAAQSKFNFRSKFHEALTESEDEGDSAPPAPQFKQTPQPETASSASSSSKSKHRHRLSEHKLLKGLPSMKSKSSKPSTETSSTASSPRQADSSLPTTSPPTSQEQDKSRVAKAPFMSQMLQARAKADIESSEATLTRPKSGRQSPSPSRKAHAASVVLPNLLKDIFQFDSAEEVIAEYPCWYLQSVLLEGYMYITQNHISFYAYLPKKSSAVIRSGHLAKRGRRNPQYRRWWFVLKGDVLSYYADPSDPYFPRDSIDLRYGISAQLLPEKDKSKDVTAFSVTTTNSRTYYFRADTPHSAKEWVKQLQKIIFRSHNDGDSVKISIPTDNVIEVEENPLLDYAETIRIKVIDNDETFAVDEYFFSFFGYGDKVLEDLRIMTQDTSAQRALTVSKPPLPPKHERRPSRVVENPLSPTLSPGILHENVRATLSPASAKRSSYHSPRTSGELSRSSLDLGQPRAESKGDDRHRGRSFSAARRAGVPSSHRREQSGSSPEPTVQPDSLATSSEQVSSGLVESMDDTDASGSHILSGSVMFHDPTIRKPHYQGAMEGTVEQSPRQSRDPRLSPVHYQPLTQPPGVRNAIPASSKTAPPSSAAMSNLPDQEASKVQSPDSSSALGGYLRAGAIPIQRATGYLKGPGKAVASLLGTSPMEYYDKVSGMIAGGQRHYSEADGLSTDDHVRDPDEEIDVRHAERRFREHFALPETERLVATYFAFLHRVFPLYGKIYVGTTKICFRTLLPTLRTKLIIPYKDMLNVDKEKGFRLGYQGMVVVIRGHEEIFFEFGKQAHRDDCTITILRALDPMVAPQASILMTGEERQKAEDAAKENLLLEVARKESRVDNVDEVPRNIYQSDPDAPAVSFDDPASSMLDFKPQESLRIVCLTIGSRGDVQPYIALCKALLAEGHRPKIATHAEFGPWVKEHGIEFAPVDGDPAELMAICVEYGMFTPSFLLEANLRFRGFVKTLLTTSWDACRDADVLIESPSAMAGIHIAEALSIPYFRAFTMPWTRTRAYPHAFAVPGHRLGGAYNYMTYVLFDHLFWTSTSGMINRWRAKSLGLKQTSADKLQQDKVPFLYNFSPSVVVPPLDFSEWIRVTGYWFLKEGPDYTPPKELQHFIEKARKDGEKLVYIGFGSVVVQDSKQLTQDVVNAVLKADVRCILAKGWSDRLDKGKPKVKGEIEVPLPPTILQITYPVPHDWLFRQVDACVHHGGAGTTGASLGAGVPTIIHPFFGDQFFFSSRVQDLGVGVEVKRITTKSLGRALWIACHDHRMREKARALGEQIRSEDGVGNAIKAIYRDMEYARTLIKKREASAKPVGEGGTTDTEEDEPDAEEWTLVENDSDPEAASPRAMMQPEPARGGGGGGGGGSRRSSGLMHSSLGRR